MQPNSKIISYSDEMTMIIKSSVIYYYNYLGEGRLIQGSDSSDWLTSNSQSSFYLSISGAGIRDVHHNTWLLKDTLTDGHMSAGIMLVLSQPMLLTCDPPDELSVNLTKP